MSTAVHVGPAVRLSTEPGVVIAANSDNPPSIDGPRENRPENWDLHNPDGGDVVSINDVKSLKKGIIKTSRNKAQVPYTILLVGETGTGKSLLLEFIGNVLLGKALDGDKFDIVDQDNEEGGSSGQSQTNSARVYELTSKNGVLVRILDAPGLADTRGIHQEELHKKSIATEIQNHIDSVTAILILANGSVPRLTPGMDYALSALSTLFPKTLAKNIAFLFTNSPSPLSLNVPRDVIPEILKDAPQFLLDNPISLQREFLEFKDDSAKKKMRREMQKMVKSAEQTALGTLVDLFDWLDGLEPQLTTEIVSLYEKSHAIWSKITTTLAQMDQASSQMAEINKLMEELPRKTANVDAFRHFERIITALVWRQQPSSTLNYLCGTPDCHSTCGVIHSAADVFLLFPRQFSLCSKCNHPHQSHFHVHSTWVQVHEVQVSVDGDRRKQWEAAKDEKERTDALIAASRSALDGLHRSIDEAMDGLAQSADEYARLALWRNFSALLEKAIWLLEQWCKGMEEKGVGLELLRKVRTSLEHMKERLELLSMANEKVREGVRRFEASVHAKVRDVDEKVEAVHAKVRNVDDKGQGRGRTTEEKGDETPRMIEEEIQERASFFWEAIKEKVREGFW